MKTSPGPDTGPASPPHPIKGQRGDGTTRWSVTDPLTGLFNRRFLRARLYRAKQQGRDCLVAN
ncbi:hypothetical protein [Alkalilimnicola ehrlichii]|uniref:hypothetical protein n=1 Tax=Alkalilimnicola ehrlichii TaxID=351052 RepID=UPI003B9F0D83